VRNTWLTCLFFGDNFQKWKLIPNTPERGKTARSRIEGAAPY